MGIKNVKAVFTRWHDLPHLPFRVLTYMAARSMDGDSPPVYYAGWEELALAAGRIVPESVDGDRDVSKERRSALVAVTTAMKCLTDRGAVKVIHKGAPGRNATYAIMLDSATVQAEPESNGAGESCTVPGSRRLNGAGSAENSAGSSCTTVQDEPAPEEQLKDQEEEQAATQSRRPDGADTTAAAAADPMNEESPKPRGSRTIAIGVVLTNTDATDDEATAVVDRIDEAKQPRNLVGLVRAIAAAGELDDWLADVRAERAARSRPPEVDGATEKKWLATLSRCDHDQAGGWVPRAKHGTPSCPSCRRAAENDMATYKRESFGRMLNEDIQRPPGVAAHQQGGPGSTRTGNGANGHHNGRNVPSNVWRGPYRETINADGSRDMSQYYKPL